MNTESNAILFNILNDYCKKKTLSDNKYNEEILLYDKILNELKIFAAEIKEEKLSEVSLLSVWDSLLK